MQLSEQALVTVRDLHVRLGNKLILKDIQLTINRRQIVSLIGPNGAGKTTLVRVILGLLAPTSGEVLRAQRVRIGYMPQRIQVDSTMPLTVHRFLARPGVRRDAIGHALAQLGCHHAHNQALSSLSGGELQRVLLARALLSKPDLLVLDEPAQGVDLPGQLELYQHIKKIRDQLNCGVLLISHDLHFVMAETDTVICLNQHVCCSGHPSDVSRDPTYLQLFTRPGMPGLAIYNHQHDHQHDLSGRIMPEQEDSD